MGISGPELAPDVETILAGCAALDGDSQVALAGHRSAMGAWREPSPVTPGRARSRDVIVV